MCCSLLLLFGARGREKEWELKEEGVKVKETDTHTDRDTHRQKVDRQGGMQACRQAKGRAAGREGKVRKTGREREEEKERKRTTGIQIKRR